MDSPPTLPEDSRQARGSGRGPLPPTPFQSLTAFFQGKNGPAAISALAREFRLLADGLKDTRPSSENIEPVVALYESVLLSLEERLAANGFKADLIKWHKKLFLELEGLLSLHKDHERHSFWVVIPVADRPVMLKHCLQSLLRQCGDFHYGGKTVDAKGNPGYARVRAVIMDDSKDKGNIKAHRDLAGEMTQAGLHTDYIGLGEQSRVVSAIPEELQEKLKHILGNCANGGQPHKGASITRNISYLWLNKQLRNPREKTLIYFIDSDEEFAVKVAGPGRHLNLGLINYFYWLDKLFAAQDIEVLTGKVVGDPPVSPAVMINTFLEDVLLFFKQLAPGQEDQPCIFHSRPSSRHSPAHYNDLVKMFGYRSSAQSFSYPCTIRGRHTSGQAFDQFSKKINGFFYGLHPTRETIYHHNAGPLDTSPARTVYTGNFVFKPEGMRYFIPYADLKLRMAGPALGRLLRARIGGKFVSANLPLLHKRTLTRNYRGEFRSGLNNRDRQIDLCEESIRQFWGDVLLFSVDKLTGQGYPDMALGLDLPARVVEQTRDEIWQLYGQNSQAISEKTARLKDYLSDPQYWWNRSEGLTPAVNRYKLFCSNLGFNFGTQSAGYEKLKGTLTGADFPARIAKSLYDFYEDERSWAKVCAWDRAGDRPIKKPTGTSAGN